MTTVFFDFETGGIAEDKPNIQLAAVAVDELWNEIESFDAKIKFDESKADAEALKINRYDPEVWEREAKPLQMVLATFDGFLQRHRSIQMVSKRTGNPYSVARLAGHNAVTFDMPRLKRMYGERFLPAHPIVLDTLQLALWYFQGIVDQPENFQLVSLLRFFGISFPAHDALADVRACVILAREIKELQCVLSTARS